MSMPLRGGGIPKSDWGVVAKAHEDPREVDSFDDSSDVQLRDKPDALDFLSQALPQFKIGSSVEVGFTIRGERISYPATVLSVGREGYCLRTDDGGIVERISEVDIKSLEPPTPESHQRVQQVVPITPEPQRATPTTNETTKQISPRRKHFERTKAHNRSRRLVRTVSDLFILRALMTSAGLSYILLIEKSLFLLFEEEKYIGPKEKIQRWPLDHRGQERVAEPLPSYITLYIFRKRDSWRKEMDESMLSGAANRPFIDLIDTLRAHGVQQDLPLPQIAVMGDQSSGKSSVLEMISGVPFPRGSGLVTRCATQLIMKRTAPGSEWAATASVSWQSLPQPAAAGPVKDAAALSSAIEQLTDVLCSSSSNGFASDTHIVINLSSPDVPDLTLIDLPGIVRTAVYGQSSSVVDDVNRLIESFLSQERTIVLAVIPSNQDIATIDILERAARADPNGERTLAVLTKPDLIDEGAEDEVKTVLANKRKPLRLGYAMVKCRSQRELDEGADASKVEKAFFENHPVWRTQDQKKLGVASLTKRLSTLLVDRIKVALPSIKYELQSQRDAAAAEYERLGGNAAAVDANDMRAEIVRVVAEYTTLLRQSARGNYGNAMLAKRAELRLFGETQTIFRDLKAEVSATQPRFEEASFVERLTAEMSAFRGRELPGFTNSQVFYGFMVQNIERWRPWVETCRQQYVAAARSVSDALAQALAPNYPALSVELRTRAHRLIDKFGDIVQERLDDVFAKESDPYTTNESMLELINKIRLKNFDVALQAVLSTAPPGSLMSSNEKVRALAKAHVKRQLGRWYMQTHGVNTTSKVEDMCTLLQAYWDVATKRLVDNVCMTLEHDFTANLLKEFESECFLFAAEYAAPDKELELSRLFREDPAVVEVRRAAKAKQSRLTDALESLKQAAPDVVAARPDRAAAPKALYAGFFQQPNDADTRALNTAYDDLRDMSAKKRATTVPTPVEPYQPPRSQKSRAPPPPPPVKKQTGFDDTSMFRTGATASPAPSTNDDLFKPTSTYAPLYGASARNRPAPPPPPKQSERQQHDLFGSSASLVANNPQMQSAALSAASNPDVQKAALSAASNPEVQSAALSAASDPRVQSAALSAASDPRVQAAAYSAASDPQLQAAAYQAGSAFASAAAKAPRPQGLFGDSLFGEDPKPATTTRKSDDFGYVFSAFQSH